jgi:uncharacterized protein (TIGR00725 family)
MRTVIGVMGGAVASEETEASAYELGRLIAENGWVLLNGGRNAGVMAASARGAAEAGGLVIGILPGESSAGVAPHVDVAIPTGMGDARNVVNVLASHVVIALPGGAGTLSEVALALKNGRPVIALQFPLGGPFSQYYEREQLLDAATPGEAVLIARRLLGESGAT